MKRERITHALAWVASLCALSCCGCGSFWEAGLPNSLDLPLVSGKTVAADIDTGPPSWANSTWSVYGYRHWRCVLHRLR